MDRVAFAFIVLSVALGGSVVPAAADTVRVHVESGTLAGVSDQGIAVFKGIPYAAPPVGDLRWRAPRPAVAWSGERAATDYGYSCPQAASPRYVLAESRAATMNEDCLTLNIWAPLVHPQPLPIIIWVHGGGNTSGTGSQLFYDGTSFARDGIVLVSFNYRLGALGFFSHPALTADAAGDPAGNFGLLDQVAALRWVHANAAAFGGDPANITLAGESAGGEDIVALATVPAARELFARAIVESAGGLHGLGWPPLARAEERGAKIASGLGLPGARATAAQLRGLPAATLARIGDEELDGPIVDGRLISAAPTRVLAAGLALPLLIGTNDDEGSLLTGDAKPEDVLSLPAADLAMLRARYPTAEASTDAMTDARVARRLFRDAFFAAPARWVAGRVAQTGTPAYLYRFDYVLSLLRGLRLGAGHGSEIPFVFEVHTTAFISETDRQVGAAVHACWASFARTGTPSCGSTPWPLYTRKNERRFVFTKAGATQSRPVEDAEMLDMLDHDLALP